MVKGLELFRRHFAHHADHFALIGGAAASEWFRMSELEFRATKDLDIVLLVEALGDSMLDQFWEFVREGSYEVRQRSDPERRYYRFMKPKNPEFPHSLELFSRVDEGISLGRDQLIVPIPPEEDASSLSAILIDDDYYHIVKSFREVVDDLPLVTPAGIMLLKARAWIDLTMRKEAGEQVDSQNINKHRNDVFRLSLLLPAGESFAIPSLVLADFRRFLDAFPEDSMDWSAIREATKITAPLPPPSELIALLSATFVSKDID